MRNPITRLAPLAMAAAFAAPVMAQDYPSGPVTLIHAYPGGPMDAVMHVVAEHLSDRWGQPVVIDTRPGANEIIAADTVAKADPDGQTIFVGSESSFIYNPYLYDSLPYDPDHDLIPVSQLFDIPFGLLIRGDLPVQNVAEFVALMQQEGPSRSYGSFGVGNIMNVGMEQFLQAAGIEMRHVPYRVAGQLMQDMFGGTIDAVVSSSIMAVRFGPTGQMRMLMIDGDNRQPILPDVPTFAEAGFPDLHIRPIIGLAVPAGTPEAVQAEIQQAFAEVINDPAFVQEVVGPNGYEVVASSPAEFQAMIAEQRPRMQQLIADLDIHLEQ
ncbi:tripartite tricarboxylate transporter substrate binding protein [Pararhodobacter sp. CCB-MM2]|uniref:Bug family tripartite tricarboxylate transporter substrate binding protein n=1 Tax=Pararhodobacter sp. CCB-MM2 TaxID=1786003 RepID=UPI00082B530A|nr:tripartite tricarboxylate transporter substrate binding protein [Pararhodobacter sp. CCB-MM2]